MKNNVKRFLVSVMAGIMMINTPLSVLAETPVNKSTEQDSSSDYTDSSVTAQILFEQESVVNYLSSLNEEDKANILSELSEKENYQLVMLALYDYINHFSKDQTLDLYKEIINSYNEKLSFDYENSTDAPNRIPYPKIKKTMVTSPNNAISGNGKNAISVTYTVMLPPIR